MRKDNTSMDDSTELRADGGTAEQDEGLFSISGQWYQIGFYLFLLAWLGFLLNEALGYSNRMDWLFPVIVGVPVGLLVLMKLLTLQYPQVAETVMPDSETTEEDEMFEAIQEVGSRASKAEKEKYELVMIGWVLLLPFMMYFVGMGWTLVGYTFGFTWYFTRSVRTSAIVTVIVIIFVWVLFIEILSLIIWNGVLGLPAPLETLVNMRG